jgi:hypothetical protein
VENVRNIKKKLFQFFSTMEDDDSYDEAIQKRISAFEAE